MITVTWTVPGSSPVVTSTTRSMVYVALAERTVTELVTADEALRGRLSQLAWIVTPDQAAR